MTVRISGIGVSGALTITTATPLNFGNVAIGRHKSTEVTFRNTGLGVLHGSVEASGLAAPFSASGAGSFTLAHGKTRSVTIRFAPTSSGAFNGTLTIASDDSVQPTANVTVTGTGK